MKQKPKKKLWIWEVIEIIIMVFMFFYVSVSFVRAVQVGNVGTPGVNFNYSKNSGSGGVTPHDCGAGNCVQSTIGGYVCVPCSISSVNVTNVYDSSNNIVLSGDNKYLYDSNLNKSIDFGNYYLYSGNHLTLDWGNRFLFGYWSALVNFTAPNLCYSNGSQCASLGGALPIWVNNTEYSIKINASYPQAISMIPLIMGNTSGNARGTQSIDIQTNHNNNLGNYNNSFVCSGISSNCFGQGIKNTAQFGLSIGALNKQDGFASQQFGNFQYNGYDYFGNPQESSSFSTQVGYSNDMYVYDTNGDGSGFLNQQFGYNNQMETYGYDYGNLQLGTNNVLNCTSSTQIGQGLQMLCDYDSGDEGVVQIGQNFVVNEGYGIFLGQGAIQYKIKQTGAYYPANNYKLYFGSSAQSSIKYDGTNMIINPKEVGSGQLKVTGNLNVTGTITTSNATGLTNYVVCYLSTGQLGHCTSVVGIGGTCTCVAN